MVDALNITIASDEDGDAGVIKIAYGNTKINFTSGNGLPSGTNKVVGSCMNKEKGEILFAVYNSSNNHSIYWHNIVTGQLRLVFRDEVLGFTADGWIKMDTLIKENNDTLLYFNDTLSDPKKINVTKALNKSVNGYPYTDLLYFDEFDLPQVYSYTPEEKLLSITVIKQPPLDPPTISYENDPTIKLNRVYNTLFQFAYQYVYEDGEVSALSPYSEIPLNSAQLFDGITSLQSRQFYNKMIISLKTSLGDVAKIRVLARQVGVAGFFIVDEVNNSRSVISPFTSVEFTNGKTKVYIQQRDVNKVFDNVPKSTNSQAIVSNRLLFGANKEFYDPYKPTFSLNFNYSGTSAPSVIGVGPFGTASTLLNVSGAGAAAWLNIASLPPTSSSVYTIDLSIKIYSPRVDISGSYPPFTSGITVGQANLEIKKLIQINPYSNRTQLADQIGAAISDDYTVESNGLTSWTSTTPAGTYITVGDLFYNVSYDSYDVSGDELQFRFKISSVDVIIQGSSGSESISAITDSVNQSFVNTVISSSSIVTNVPYLYGFKRKQSHYFGIFYSGLFGRVNSTSELGAFTPDWFSDTGDNLGPASVSFRLTGQAPSWAKRWHLVYAPYADYNFSYVYSSAEAFTQATIDSTGLNPIYISLRHLEGKPSSYKESKSAIFDYSFVEGDRLRIVSYRSQAGSTVYPKDIDFLVVGLDVLDTSNNSFLVPSSPSQERKTGIFLKLKGETYPGFSAGDIQAGTSFWARDCIFEIYRPTSVPDDKIYFEIAASGPVLFNSSLNQFVHGGQRDFRYSPIFSLTANRIVVISGVGTTSLDVRNGDSIVISAGTFNIGNVSLNEEGKREFLISAPNGTYIVSSIVNKNDSVNEVTVGDVYYRPRQIKLNPLSGTNPDPSILDSRYQNIFVEDQSISDFYRSNFISIGRPNAASETAKEVFRKASITWSDPYFLDTSVLGLSSFNLSGGNFIDLQAEHGEIKYIHSNSDSIVVLQENKCSVLPVSRNVIEYLDGGAGVTVSNAFIGQQSFYAGEFGVGDFPESFASYYGKLFFADNRNGKVIRISGDGIELISEQGMDAFFQKLFEEVNRRGPQNFKVYGGIDPRNKEYIISIQKISGSFAFENQTIGYSIDDKVWSSRYSFMPETMTEINGEMYSFKAGEAYVHTVSSTPRTYYGIAYPSKVSVVSSQNKSMVKSFEAVGLESSKPWSFKCSTRTQATGNVLFSNMTKKEDMFYHEIPTDNNSLPIQMIGTVQATGVVGGGLSVSVDSNINMLPIEFGSPIFKLVSGSLVATSYTAADITNFKTITIAGTGSVTAGDVLVARQSGSINGDKLRGNYMLIELEVPTSHTDIQDMELFAINTWFTRNSIHNDLVN
jgi:hypothetical protein